LESRQSNLILSYDMSHVGHVQLCCASTRAVL
jgi:hypothetical protein